MMSDLSHVDQSGAARMVDVGGKAETVREAIARGRVTMQAATLEQVKANAVKKGDVLAVARVAGIMAAKRTPDLIPLCHTILTDEITVDFDLSGEDGIGITTRARSTGKTGVEMEALVAASVAALTIYDMCKAVDRGMAITDVRLESKTGGKSGTYRRPEA
jgi:cyclic pyranopterin phosphate synthase